MYVPMPTHCNITYFGFHARWIDGVKCGLFFESRTAWADHITCGTSICIVYGRKLRLGDCKCNCLCSVIVSDDDERKGEGETRCRLIACSS